MLRNWIVVLVGCLILGFQNCSQNGLTQSDFASASVHIVTPSVGVSSDLEGEEITALQVPLDQGYLLVQPESGKISYVVNEQEVDQFCLGATELTELQSYLNSKNICSKTQDAEVMCAQTYTAGYATLIFGEAKMNLGESFDSCGKGFKDICGDQAQSFRGLVAYLQKNYQTLACSQ